MESCKLKDLGVLELGFGILVTTVLVLSYVPQIMKLIKTKNSYGISSYAQMLSFTAQTLTLFNIFLLQQKLISCCILGKYSIPSCMGYLIGFIQVFLQWCCITTIVFLFIRYFPSPINQEYTAIDMQGEILIREWRIIIRVVYALVVMLVVIVSLSLIAVFMDWDEESITYLAGVYGVIATVFSLIQFLPQIRKTYSNKSVGALSIPSMLIQCPGSFVIVLFLAIQPGTNWTTWITYFAGGTLQGILLLLCIYYSIKNKRRPLPPEQLHINDNDNFESEGESTNDNASTGNNI